MGGDGGDHIIGGPRSSRVGEAGAGVSSGAPDPTRAREGGSGDGELPSTNTTGAESKGVGEGSGETSPRVPDMGSAMGGNSVIGGATSSGGC